jgi:transposase-like protein
VAQNYLTGGTLHSLARQHDLSRNPIRIWIQEFEGRRL